MKVHNFIVIDDDHVFSGVKPLLPISPPRADDRTDPFDFALLDELFILLLILLPNNIFASFSSCLDNFSLDSFVVTIILFLLDSTYLFAFNFSVLANDISDMVPVLI